MVGLEIDWTKVEVLYDKFGLAPQAPSQASRVAVPVYRGKQQVGKAIPAHAEKARDAEDLAFVEIERHIVDAGARHVLHRQHPFAPRRVRLWIELVQ